MAATIQIKRGTSGPINLTHLLDGELAYDKDNNKLYIGKDGSKIVINSVPTAAEVGADPSGSANTALTNAKAYTDTALNTAKSYTDTALNAAKSYTDTSVANLINSAPTTLDTLGEIATAMNENAEVVDALEASIGTKANASDLTSHTGNKSNPHGVTLSQLGVSATAAELNYVDGVTSNIQTQLNAKAATSAIPTKTSQLTNDSGFKTTDNNTTYTISKSGSTITLTGSDGKTSSVTDSDTNTTYSAATTSAAGLMSAADKTKLDGIATGANKITVDTALSSTSTNPVQNKVINTALASKANTSAIPTKTSQLTNDSGFKTTDNNTTYSLSKSGSTITLTGSDGSTTSVTDADTNTTYSAATTSANGLMTSTMVTKLNGIATGANNYSHPTTSGNKHIPSGGSSGQILRWSADGTAVWGADNNTTYSAGTGISLSGTTFSNSGVRSIATGSTNGTISVNTNGTSANVAVKGLGSAAYTDSSIYRVKTLGSFSGSGDTAEYCLLGTIKVISSYINTPVEITLQERGRASVARLEILFNSGDTLDPSLLSFLVNGRSNGYYMYKSATSTWQIYVHKNESWSGMKVVDYTDIPGATITWSFTNATLPTSGLTQAGYMFPISAPTVHTGTGAPASSLGKNGDIYIVTG